MSQNSDDPIVDYAAVPPWDRLNRLAIASFVLAIIAVGLTPILCSGDASLKILGPVTLLIVPAFSLAAIVALAIAQMKQGRGRRAMGLAVAGIAIGAVHLAIYGYLFIAFSKLLIG